jgi:hypothetical protein
MAKKQSIADRQISQDVEEPTEQISAEYGSREEAMDRMLDRMEKQLVDGEIKATVADYLRLIQVRREVAESRPREIEITWVNSLGEENAHDA